MERAKTNLRLESWVEELLSLGRYGFALDQLRKAFPEQSETANKFALKRLSDKNKIISIYKGYYLILPPQYAKKGVLPVPLFLDAFMHYLQRPYYVSLLNAAAYQGASHQQSQEFFVITTFPVLRATQKRGLKINYMSINKIPEGLIVKHKTEAGYLNVSSPALTATDLVQFEKRTGGLNRVSTILNELANNIKPSDFKKALFNHVPATAFQRLGYLLEFVCNQQNLADTLFKTMEDHKLMLFRIPLKASKTSKGFSSANRWNVIVNTEIEIDE